MTQIITITYNDSSFFSYNTGTKDNYQIHYNDSKLKGHDFLLIVETPFKPIKKNIEQLRRFDKLINNLNKNDIIDEKNKNDISINKQKLENIIETYKDLNFCVNTTEFSKIICLIAMMFHSQDYGYLTNTPVKPILEKNGFHCRDMYTSEIKRVIILNEDIDTVYNKYDNHNNNTSVYDYMNLIKEAKGKVKEKLYRIDTY